MIIMIKFIEYMVFKKKLNTDFFKILLNTSLFHSIKRINFQVRQYKIAIINYINTLPNLLPIQKKMKF